MKYTRITAALLATAAALFVTAGTVSSFAWAGPLTPAAGPVTGSYKTLSEVEPRIAVNATNTPGDNATLFIINQPGSYFLTGNINTSAMRSAIRINSDDVTIDLSGFTINGSGDSIGTASGILATAPHRNIVIRGGGIRGFRGYGIIGPMSLAHFEDLAIANCGLGQLEVLNADNSIARNIRITAIAGEAALTLGNNALVEDCTVEGGFLGISIQSGTITRCTVANVAGVGIRSGGGIVSDCTVSNITNAGSFNNGGIVAGNGTRIERCILRNCVPCGVFVGGTTDLTACTFYNCGKGVLASTFASGKCRIEGNTFSGSTTAAVSLETPRHLVIGNRFTGNAANIVAVAGSTLGEVLNFSSGGTLTGANTHGAANLIY